MPIGKTSSPPRALRKAAMFAALVLTATVCGQPARASGRAAATTIGAATTMAAATVAAATTAAAGASQREIRLVEMSTRIGRAGAEVTIRTGRLPAVTPIQITIGATRSGFEELAFGLTDDRGDFETTVEVPDWTRRDQAHRFIVFDLYFTTILAESGIFHVTDADGRVAREGTVGSAGTDCITLEGDDEVRYQLTGDTDGLDAGERVALEGTLSESAEGCGAGVALVLSVDAIR